MQWVNNHLVQISYFLNFLGEVLPAVLAVAVIFTFFIVQGFSRKLERMAFYLDRIDNHLSEISYLLKNQAKPSVKDETEKPDRGEEEQP